MDRAAKSSLARDIMRAALVSAAMISMLGAVWAASKYRKDIQAHFYALNWALAGGKDPTRALMGLEDRPAAANACRLAYRLARGSERKSVAADMLGTCGGIRDLYALVTRTGEGSPAEDALLCRIKLAGEWGWLEPELGAEAEIDPSKPPDELKEMEVSKRAMRYRLDSYDIEIWRTWTRSVSLSGGPGRPAKASYGPWQVPRPCCRGADDVRITRLPGPWRDLPPIPPPRPPDETDYSEL